MFNNFNHPQIDVYENGGEADVGDPSVTLPYSNPAHTINSIDAEMSTSMLPKNA